MHEDFSIALWDQLRARAYNLGASLDGLFDTPEHFRMTEERLGFPLPTYLRDLFSRVAQGGEPYHGHRPMSSLTGGHPSTPDMDGLGLAALRRMISQSGWRLNEKVERALKRRPGLNNGIQCEELPDGFVTLSYEGCNIHVELDGWMGELYLSGLGEDIHSYRIRLGEAPPEDSEYDYMVTLSYFADSYEDWKLGRCHWEVQGASSEIVNDSDEFDSVMAWDDKPVDSSDEVPSK